MKKLILWMIRTFKVDIPTERIVTKVVEKTVYVPHDGVIEGDITIKGNVTVLGSLTTTGGLTCYKKEV